LQKQPPRSAIFASRAAASISQNGMTRPSGWCSVKAIVAPRSRIVRGPWILTADEPLACSSALSPWSSSSVNAARCAASRGQRDERHESSADATAPAARKGGRADLEALRPCTEEVSCSVGRDPFNRAAGKPGTEEHVERIAPRDQGTDSRRVARDFVDRE